MPEAWGKISQQVPDSLWLVKRFHLMQESI
jgi:hypothetical protein